MLLKYSVKFKSKDQAMCAAMIVVNTVFIKHGFEMIITSANDSTHGVNSLHFQDAAIDVRTKHLPSLKVKQDIVAEIKTSLIDDFDVILEGLNTDNEHCHIEWQPKHAVFV